MTVLSLTANSTVADTLGTTGDYYNPTTARYSDAFHLENLTPGVPVTVALNSNNFDTFVYIVNGDSGAVVAYDDDSGAGSNSLLTFTPTFGDQGSYYVVATSYASNSTGAYTVSATQG